jgi:TolB-like protein/tetratricopeptide (TPR) repeat protein/DNA-binding winged helix-turn-helix (wHTH) protein
MDARLQQGFRVGEFDVRPLEGRIIGPAGEQHVQPKVMEVLLCLAEQPGEIVERDALLARGWGGAVVTPDVLTRCISELRHLLDDHHDSVRYIQTIPKRGYRLVAGVQPAAPAAGPATVGAASAEQTPPSPVGGRPTADRAQTGPVLTFWEDLQRRNVVRISVAYVVVAWLLLQVGEVVFDALRLPDWALTLLLALLALGFPVAVVIAWAFQITEHGVVLDRRGAGPRARTTLRRNLDMVIIGALVIAVGVLGYRAYQSTNLERASTSDVSVAQPNSLAVLRFQNIGASPDTAYIADGLGEQLLTFLSQFREFRVASRTSAWPLSNRELDIPTIAQRLKVQHVLEGSIQRDEDKIRVWTQLLDMEGFHIWSETYDRELDAASVFEIQDSIATAVAQQLEIVFSDDSVQRLGMRPTESTEALDAYLRGLDYLRGVHSTEDLDTAASFFAEAIDIDPRYAAAYAALCLTHLHHYELVASPEQFEAAEKSCHRALTLDDALDDVYAALGELYRRSGQPDKAMSDFNRALDLNPDSFDALYGVAMIQESSGRLDEAESVYRKAIAAQPGYWLGYNSLGIFLGRNGHFEKAAKEFEEVLALVPDRAVGYVNTAAAYNRLGRFEDALALYEKATEIEPTRAGYTNMGLTYYRLSRYAQAAAMHRLAIEMAPDDHRAWGRLGDAQRHAGQTAEAQLSYREAVTLADEALEINPDSGPLLAAQAHYLARLGDIERAKQLAQLALERAPSTATVHTMAARVYAAAGDAQTSLALLETAVELGESRYFIAADPDFASLKQRGMLVALLPEDDQSRQ